jgi:MFS family permease
MLLINPLSRITGNARFAVLTQIIWAIPFFLINSYASLYMINQGITEKQVGEIRSFTFAVMVVSSLFAGYIVDRFGRKRALILFDIITWVVPYAIYAFATQYWHFVLAGIFSGFMMVNGVAWSCILVETTEAQNRVAVFNMMEIINVVAGFFIPITGLLIKKFSFIPAMRGLYVFGFFFMILTVSLRAKFIQESPIGKIKLQQTSKSLSKMFLGLIHAPQYIIKNKALVFLFAINLVFNFCLVINSLFFFPYLTKHLNFSNSFVSVFPFIGSFVALFMLLLIIPRLNRGYSSLGVGIMLYIAGAFFLISTSGNHSLIFVIVNVLLWAVARLLTNIVLQTETANAIDDPFRANVMGFYGIFSNLFMLPAGFLGGLMYEYKPVFPFYAITFLYVIIFFLFLFGLKGTALGIRFKNSRAVRFVQTWREGA